MRKVTLAIALFLLSVPIRLSSSINTIGIDYATESNSLVYGGTRYYAKSNEVEDVRTLYAMILGSNTRTVLYRAQGALNDVKASPQGALTGVLESVWEPGVDASVATFVDRRVGEDDSLIESYYLEDSILRILTLEGVVLDSISNVRRYSWDPSGRQLAYITGTYREGGLGFSTTGTWIYDVEAQQAERIYSGGLDVEWAEWDGNIYIYHPYTASDPETVVFRFDPREAELVPTSHQGFNFSPNGAYYYAQGYGGAPLNVFRTATDEVVSISLSVESTDRTWPVAFARGWLDENTIILPSPDPSDRGDYLYDIGTRTMRYAPGSVIPVRRPDLGALIVSGLSVDERNVGDLEVVRID